MNKKNNLEKLRILLIEWEEPCFKKRPKNLTLNMFRTMEYIFEALHYQDCVRFLNADLAPYLKKCGFTVDEPAGEEINFIVRK